MAKTTDYHRVARSASERDSAGSRGVYRTLSALRGASGRALRGDRLVYLRGYHAEGDGGGGYFRYDPGSAVPEDGGAVIAPAGGQGRFLRIAEGRPRPEWFGAKGDGVISPSRTGHRSHEVSGTDDHDALLACLRVYGECHLGPRTYCVGRELRPAHGSLRIYGTDKEKSVIAFLGGTRADDGTGQESLISIGPATQRFEMRDCQVYANQFNRRKRNGGWKTVQCLRVRARVVILEDLVLWGFGRAVGDQECFAVAIGKNAILDHDASQWHGEVVVRRVEWRGSAYDPEQGDGYPEVTYLLMTERINCLVADNWYHDLRRLRGVYPARQRLISASSCHGVRIERNLFERVDANMVYWDNGHNKDVVVRGNSVRESTGAFIFNANSFAVGSTHNYQICDNIVHMREDPNSINPSAFGIELRAHASTNADVYRNVQIHDNQFLLGEVKVAWQPMGVLIEAHDHATGRITRPTITNLFIHDNVFDVPDRKRWTAKIEPDTIYARMVSPFAIVGCPREMWGESAKQAHPHVQARCWANVGTNDERIRALGFLTSGAGRAFSPLPLSAANTQLDFEPDEKELSAFGVNTACVYNQATNMRTFDVNGFRNCFYLFGKGPADPSFPGPDGKYRRFYFGMWSNGKESPNEEWTILMPDPASTAGYEGNTTGITSCPPQISLEMAFWRPGHTYRFVGRENGKASKPYVEIAKHTVPASGFLRVLAYWNEQRGAQPGRAPWDIHRA